MKTVIDYFVNNTHVMSVDITKGDDLYNAGAKIGIIQLFRFMKFKGFIRSWEIREITWEGKKESTCKSLGYIEFNLRDKE